MTKELPARPLLSRINARFSVGTKLSVLSVCIAIAAGAFVAWSVYQTQSDQIRKDFEARALQVAHGMEATVTTSARPVDTDQERLQQILTLQAITRDFTMRNPSTAQINVYAAQGDQTLIVISSDPALLGTTPEPETITDIQAALTDGLFSDEEAINDHNALEIIVPITIEGQPPLNVGVHIWTAERDAALTAVQHTFGRNLAIAIAGVIVVAYGAVWLLVTRPLQRLTRATDRMRAGDYRARVDGWHDTTAGDEIERLAGGFNTMAHAIEDLHNETTSLASSDPLTGIYNRRIFLELLPREMERSRRDGQPLAVAMLDLDNFKQINDKYGHEIGDQALRNIAEALRQTARAGDTTARFGGDEFVFLLPNCDQRALRDVMDRLRAKVEELCATQAGDGERVFVTVSAGGAFSQDGDTVDSLMHRADLALFEAKRAGRNQVRLAA
ncbi:MAG: GGDEF domain-containing protein [Dehalococcoidia bacterium]